MSQSKLTVSVTKPQELTIWHALLQYHNGSLGVSETQLLQLSGLTPGQFMATVPHLVGEGHVTERIQQDGTAGISHRFYRLKPQSYRIEFAFEREIKE